MNNTSNGSPPSKKRHRQWLRLQLAYNDIDHDYLIAVLISLERAVNSEQQRLLKRPVDPPFYRLSENEDNARSWTNTAEIALWLRYKGYQPIDWFETLCNWPPIRRRLLWQQRVPLNMFAPTTRLSLTTLQNLDRFYLEWKRQHGNKTLRH